MNSNMEFELLLQVARLYYEDDQNQDQIAETLGISRSKISRLLTEARREGIVQITIVDPLSSHTQLEQALAKNFGLNQAIVVAGVMPSEEMRRKRIGQAAARYLETTLVEGDRIGIASGRTLYALATALSGRRRLQVDVIPLIGGLGRVPACFQSNELARMVAETLGGAWRVLYVPAVLENRAARQSMFTHDHVQEIMDSWKDLTVAIIGIANPLSPSGTQTLFANFLDQATQKRLLEQGATGGICVRYIDAQGGQCHELSDRVIGIDLDQLRRVPRVIGVAGGLEKVEAILATLRGQYVNALITDEETARALLEEK